MAIRLADEVEARLQQLGFQNDVTAWEIGDLTEWLFQLLTRVIDDKEVLVDPQTEEVIGAGVLYATVAKHAGKAPAAIRDYRYTSRHIPIGVRQDYHMLGRHHWKALIPHAKTTEDLRWWGNQILEWADDYGGAIITVAALRHKLSARTNSKERRWERPYHLACSNLGKMLKQKDEEAAPLFIQLAAENFLKAGVPLP